MPKLSLSKAFYTGSLDVRLVFVDWDIVGFCCDTRHSELSVAAINTGVSTEETLAEVLKEFLPRVLQSSSTLYARGRPSSGSAGL